jgi:translation initiation factor IF-1
MPREIPVRAEVTIQEKLSPKHYRATLPNGKEIRVHLTPTAPDAWRDLPPGSRVVVEMTPYDFDHGRIAALLSEVKK